MPSTSNNPIAPEQMLQVLNATETRLRNKGWCKYISINSVGKCCLGGAIDIAIKEVVPDNPYGGWRNNIGREKRRRELDCIHRLFIEDPLVAKRAGESIDDISIIIRFNDHKDTTEEEVLSLIERTKARIQ